MDSQADQQSPVPRQVVEFVLGDQVYCVPIDTVAELVDRDSITTVPDAPAHVNGLMDLRGETTTIIDPCVPLEIAAPGDQDRVIVFEQAADGVYGWLVDAVREVATVDPESIEYNNDSRFVTGVIKRNEEFVLWLDPAAVTNPNNSDA